MPTQIIDGFKLNSAAPIDSRMITSGTSSRNSMSYKYVGLRVYDTAQNLTFLWNGTAWVEDGASELKVAGAKVDYLPKYTATGLTSSFIRESVIGVNRYVGINITETTQLSATLQVGGTVCATTFCGGINGNNIMTNTITPVKLATAGQNGNYVLKSVSNTVQWIQESTISAVTTQLDTQTTKSFISFVNNTSSTEFKASYLNDNSFIGADLSTSQLTLSNTNNNTNPAYSFIGSKSTGLYGSSAEVGISLAGNKRIFADATTTKIAVGTTNIIDVSSTCIGLNADTCVNGTLGVDSLAVKGMTIDQSGSLNVTGTANFVQFEASGPNTLGGNTTSTGIFYVKEINQNFAGSISNFYGSVYFNKGIRVTEKINIQNIPSAPGGLQRGDVYRDGNILKIVT
jgi:hypothetical protein